MRLFLEKILQQLSIPLKCPFNEVFLTLSTKPQDLINYKFSGIGSDIDEFCLRHKIRPTIFINES